MLNEDKGVKQKTSKSLLCGVHSHHKDRETQKQVHKHMKRNVRSATNKIKENFGARGQSGLNDMIRQR